jgi:hypothetical protein
MTNSDSLVARDPKAYGVTRALENIGRNATPKCLSGRRRRDDGKIAVDDGLVLLLVRPAMAGQVCALDSQQAATFMGTWAIAMTEPSGGHETVRIWDKGGVVAASIQSEQSSPIDITGMVKDGGTLVLTTTRFENGKTIWAVIALTLDGDTMKMAQMLEPSRSIELASGKRQ